MIKIIRDVNFHAIPDFNKLSILEIAEARKFFTVVDFIKLNLNSDAYKNNILIMHH